MNNVYIIQEKRNKKDEVSCVFVLSKKLRMYDVSDVCVTLLRRVGELNV